jgi:hypothetical protein
MKNIRLFYFSVFFVIFMVGSCNRITSNIPEVPDNTTGTINNEIFPTNNMTETVNNIEKTNNVVTEIFDLNGTWQPDWSYKLSLELSVDDRERDIWIEKFSWGEGKSLLHTTFEIDITADKPFVIEPGLGIFFVTEFMQITSGSKKINAYRGDLSDPDGHWLLEFIFHFIDMDTLWIETYDFPLSQQYGEGVLWHRLSGPVKN